MTKKKGKKEAKEAEPGASAESKGAAKTPKPKQSPSVAAASVSPAPPSSLKRPSDAGGGGEAAGDAVSKKAKATETPPPMENIETPGSGDSQSSRHVTPQDSPEPTKPSPRVKAPNVTLQIVVPGAELGIDQILTFMVPTGSDLGNERSWATSTENDAPLLGRTNAAQLSAVAVHETTTADAPCAAGVPAAIFETAATRFDSQTAAVTAKLAEAQATPAAKTSGAESAGSGADETALLQNFGLLSPINPNEDDWTELAEQFDATEECMSISTTGCNAERKNEVLLQAASQALTGSASEVSGNHMKESKDGGGDSTASHEGLRDLVTTTHRPNDASSIEFQGLVHTSKAVSRHTNAQTLVASFERKHGELRPNGVDANDKCDHRMTQFTASIVNCFPKLTKKFKGKEPRSCGDTVEWFSLQFTGGVVPRGEATVGAAVCTDCSGHHVHGRCRLTAEDGAEADRTIDRQQNRRNQCRRPAGDCTRKQVAALDERVEHGHGQQEELDVSNHSIAALAGQFNRQNDQRDADRGGEGRGRERGSFQRSRGRGRGNRGGPPRDRNWERNDRDHDDAVAREVKKQIANLNVSRIDVGDSGKQEMEKAFDETGDGLPPTRIVARQPNECRTVCSNSVTGRGGRAAEPDHCPTPTSGHQQNCDCAACTPAAENSPPIVEASGHVHVLGRSFDDQVVDDVKGDCVHECKRFHGASVHAVAWGGRKHKTLLDTGCSFEFVMNGKANVDSNKLTSATKTKA